MLLGLQLLVECVFDARYFCFPLVFLFLCFVFTFRFSIVDIYNDLIPEICLTTYIGQMSINDFVFQ